MKTMSNDLISREKLLHTLEGWLKLHARVVPTEIGKAVYMMIEEYPTVPHEMTAREYLLERNRLCRTVAGCDACPIFGDIHWDCEMLEKEFPQKAVAIVEAWAREHPERSEE